MFWHGVVAGFAITPQTGRMFPSTCPLKNRNCRQWSEPHVWCLAARTPESNLFCKTYKPLFGRSWNRYAPLPSRDIGTLCCILNLVCLQHTNRCTVTFLSGSKKCACACRIYTVFTWKCLCILSSTLETDGGFCSLFFLLTSCSHGEKLCFVLFWVLCALEGRKEVTAAWANRMCKERVGSGEANRKLWVL